MRVVSSSDDDSICPYSGTNEVIYIRTVKDCAYILALRKALRVGPSFTPGAWTMLPFSMK